MGFVIFLPIRTGNYYKGDRMEEKVVRKRMEILEKIKDIKTMVRGTLSEQYYNRTDKNGEVRVWGPYYKLQCWRNGKNHTQRIPADKVELIRKDLNEWKLFKSLCDEFADITEKSSKNVRFKDGEK